MRILYVTVLALAALASGAGTTARAQAPFPFAPEPDFSRRPQCTRDYLRSVQSQAEALEKLRTAGPEAIGRICTMIEAGSAWLGGKLPDDARKELRGLLGVDIDIDQLAAQCRTGQDVIEREITSKLRQLKAELVRCDDTI
jgi:hypothetical protein